MDGGKLTIVGTGASDELVLRLQEGSPSTLEVDVGADGTADFTFDRNTFTAIDVDAGGGDDAVRIDQSGGAFADELVTIDGGNGADTLVGGLGAEVFVGGAGDDFVSGGRGTDKAQLGDGDDRFQWNPGDDSDTVDGQGGKDLLDFFGANIGETIDVSASGSRVRFTRDIAGIAMDLGGMERIGFHAFGGADSVAVDDLGRTETKTVAVDLAVAGGGGDASADTVAVNGTTGGDNVSVGSQAGDIVVSGLAAQVQVAGGEAALDTVAVATLGGADSIATGVGVSPTATIAVDGGGDADTARYTGSAAADTIEVVANGAAVATVAPRRRRLPRQRSRALPCSGSTAPTRSRPQATSRR